MALGIDKLTHEVRVLGQKIDALAAVTNADETKTLSAIHALLCSLNERLGKLEIHIMAQIDDMNVKLQAIADQETKLGTDIDQVVAALKQIPNPPPDLSAQLTKLDEIAQKLIDTDAATLANLPPAPTP